MNRCGYPQCPCVEYPEDGCKLEPTLEGRVQEIVAEVLAMRAAAEKAIRACQDEAKRLHAENQRLKLIAGDVVCNYMAGTEIAESIVELEGLVGRQQEGS